MLSRHLCCPGWKARTSFHPVTTRLWSVSVPPPIGIHNCCVDCIPAADRYAGRSGPRSGYRTRKTASPAVERHPIAYRPAFHLREETFLRPIEMIGQPQCTVQTYTVWELWQSLVGRIAERKRSHQASSYHPNERYLGPGLTSLVPPLHVLIIEAMLTWKCGIERPAC